MSRYIDLDEFLEDEGEAYMNAQIKLAKENADKTIDATRYINQLVHKKLMMLIADTPSIDICFCKECKHNYNKVLNHGKMKPRCDFTDRVLTENDFCSRGEREGE